MCFPRDIFNIDDEDSWSLQSLYDETDELLESYIESQFLDMPEDIQLADHIVDQVYVYDYINNSNEMTNEEIHRSLLQWQDCYYDYYLKYCSGILASSDQYILDFYATQYPDSANPVLRKGCDYLVFNRMLKLEEEYGATALTLDPESYFHVYGKFYADKFDDNGLKYYCLGCIRSAITQDRNDINVSEFHGYYTETELLNKARSAIVGFKYWCYYCDSFLFNIDSYFDYSELNCTVCEDFVPHDPKYLEEDTHCIIKLPSNPRTVPLEDKEWPTQ